MHATLHSPSAPSVTPSLAPTASPTVACQVRRAQHLGAVGVIIADNTCLCSDEQNNTCQKQPEISCEQVEPIMADDGSGGDIIIPRCACACMPCVPLQLAIGLAPFYPSARS